MNSKLKAISLDFLWICIYLISSSIIGMLFCSPITEGYICMIAIGIVSLLASLITASGFLIFRLVFKNVKALNLSLRLLLLFSFELMYWVTMKEPLLFGVFGSSVEPYATSKIAISMSSIVGTFVLYGVFKSTKTWHSQDVQQ